MEEKDLEMKHHDLDITSDLMKQFLTKKTNKLCSECGKEMYYISEHLWFVIYKKLGVYCLNRECVNGRKNSSIIAYLETKGE